MTWEDWDKALLALTLWREARGEGYEGMRAVGHVVRNRIVGGLHWETILEKRWQFSSLTAPGDPMLVQWPCEPDDAWENAMILSEMIYTNKDEDNTGGATHYFNPHVVMPAWAATLTHTKDIGKHSFYK